MARIPEGEPTAGDELAGAIRAGLHHSEMTRGGPPRWPMRRASFDNRIGATPYLQPCTHPRTLGI